MFHRFTLAGCLAAALALPATAHDGSATHDKGDVSVSHVYTVAGSATAHAIEVFMTIENTGDDPVVLTGAEIDFAAPGLFHAPTIGDDGTLAVRTVPAVEIAAGQILTMQPGGLRVVFNDVQQVLTAGDHFEAHLAFEGLGQLDIEVDVEAPTTGAGGDGDLG